LRILNLISGPRNISTALMYSFAQRSDTQVLDEPFYACYLVKSKANHPGRNEVIESLPNSEHGVRELIAGYTQKPVLFIKNMAHHIALLDDPLIAQATNIFLIRNPAQILASYARVIEQPTMRDIGIAYQYTLFTDMMHRGEQPIVVDTGLLLKNPREILGKLCKKCEIVFEQRMLHWPVGPKHYDGVWATHWYANVHASSGFKNQSTSSQLLPEHLVTLCKEANIFYEKLLPFSLKA
jgi:hypothetical protein